MTNQPPPGFLWAAISMTAFAILTIGGLVRALRRSPTWSIGDALSEEAGNQGPLAPGQRPVMVASASRTIAMFGLFVIMSGVFGIGCYIVWALFHDHSLDGLEKVTPFFYGSAAIFAPYAVNQMKEAFVALGTTAQPPAPIAQPATVPPSAPSGAIVIQRILPPRVTSPAAPVQPVTLSIVQVPQKAPTG